MDASSGMLAIVSHSGDTLHFFLIDQVSLEGELYERL